MVRDEQAEDLKASDKSSETRLSGWLTWKQTAGGFAGAAASGRRVLAQTDRGEQSCLATYGGAGIRVRWTGQARTATMVGGRPPKAAPGRQATLALRGLNGRPSGRGVCPWRGCGSPCTRMGQAVKGAGREDSFWGFPEDRGAPRVLRREGIMARHRGPSPPQVRTQRKGDPSPLRTALPIFTCWL